MKLELDTGEGNLIRGLAEGAILVGNESLSQPFILTIDHLIRDWAPPAVEDLSPSDFEAILALEPEVILLGTGTRQRFPPARLTAAILRQGVGIEVMNTAAACRTYNVLAGEFRRVAAALFIT